MSTSFLVNDGKGAHDEQDNSRNERAASHRVIAFWIAQHINGRFGKGYPSQDWLAELAGTSVATVERAVRTLAKTGWLIVERERTYDYKTRSWKTHNTYSMCFNGVQAMLDEITVKRRKRRLKRVTGDTSEPVTGVGSENVLPFKPVTGDGLTPSNKNLPLKEEEKASVGEGYIGS